MWILSGNYSLAYTRRAIYPKVLLIWICIFSVGVNARTFKRKDFIKNNSTFNAGKHDFSQKKPRSAQYRGFMPRLQALYPRQSVPLRLAAIPVNAGYRSLPIATKLTKVPSLARLRSLQRTYVPIINSVQSIRYPVVTRQDAGLSNQYVMPFALKMPGTQILPATQQTNEDLRKHYNQKYNTMPSIANLDLMQDDENAPRKTENKKLDIGDDFDNFLASLGMEKLSHVGKFAKLS